MGRHGDAAVREVGGQLVLAPCRQLFPPESLFTLADLVTQLDAAGFRVDLAKGRAIALIKAHRR